MGNIIWLKITMCPYHHVKITRQYGTYIIWQISQVSLRNLSNQGTQYPFLKCTKISGTGRWQPINSVNSSMFYLTYMNSWSKRYTKSIIGLGLWSLDIKVLYKHCQTMSNSLCWSMNSTNVAKRLSIIQYHIYLCTSS